MPEHPLLIYMLTFTPHCVQCVVQCPNTYVYYRMCFRCLLCLHKLSLCSTQVVYAYISLQSCDLALIQLLYLVRALSLSAFMESASQGPDIQRPLNPLCGTPSDLCFILYILDSLSSYSFSIFSVSCKVFVLLFSDTSRPFFVVSTQQHTSIQSVYLHCSQLV